MFCGIGGYNCTWHQIIGWKGNVNLLAQLERSVAAWTTTQQLTAKQCKVRQQELTFIDKRYLSGIVLADAIVRCTVFTKTGHRCICGEIWTEGGHYSITISINVSCRMVITICSPEDILLSCGAGEASPSFIICTVNYHLLGWNCCF